MKHTNTLLLACLIAAVLAFSVLIACSSGDDNEADVSDSDDDVDGPGENCITCDGVADCVEKLGQGYGCSDGCCVKSGDSDDDDDSGDDDSGDDDSGDDDSGDDDSGDDDDDNDDDDTPQGPTYPNNHKNTWYCYFCHDSNFMGVTPQEPHGHEYDNDECLACHKKGTWVNDPFAGGHMWALNCLTCHEGVHDKAWQEKAQCLVCHGDRTMSGDKPGRLSLHPNPTSR